MYKGFNIIIDDMINKDVNTIDNEIEKYFQEYKDDDIDNEEYINKLYYDSVVKQDKNTIFNNLDKFKKYDNGTEYLDFTKVKDLYFPTLESYHVFLSHSHNDLKLVKKIALLLYHKYKLRAFIDEPIWLYCNDLIKLIDVNFCRNRKDQNGNIIYNYNDRNRTTAHVYTILSNALIEMINKCDYFFFIYTGESTLEIKKDELTGTKSPWIYTEINTTRLFQQKLKMVNFSEEDIEREEMNIFYELKLDHLIESSINEMVKKENKEELINYLDKENPFDMYMFLNRKK
ncbi:hypothetical protein NEI03_02500 [Brachyspira pilosicoli]|uniref:hypothetical protein n=1 Tax=Brachyspira pilosicoli TaxID=52584 RepID=UPI002542F177|nr:hypothetical protein [Brachyspira pilosicoli]WIH86300.1 hypothetical protein NEI03_02500 [Brachyspira pilosicoli]